MLDNESRDDQDERLFRQAVMLVWDENKVSTSFIQRRLSIGYNKAASLVERMEEMQIVSAVNHIGKREVRNPDDIRKVLQLRDDIIDAAGEEDGNAILEALVGSFQSMGAIEDSKSHMKETPADREVRDGAYRVTAGELRSFVERFERLESEKKDIAEQQK